MECMYERYIKDFRCKYYILKRTERYLDDGEMYGIMIEKLDLNGKVIESAVVNSVDNNEPKVRKLIAKLNKARVTPVTLNDIIVDGMC